MSKSDSQNPPRRCKECERIVVLSKKDNRQLVAKCECSERSIKVAKATPQTWE